MSEKQARKKQGPGQVTWLWAILAVVSVGLFLGWLAMTSEPTKVAVVERDTSADMGIAPIPLSEFTTTTQALAESGEQIRLDGLAVIGRLGDQAFWFELPGGTPYLVKLDTTLVRQGLAVAMEDRISVSGRVWAMSDSVVSDWIERGAISEEQRLEAEFATSFVEAAQLRLAPRQQ